MVCVWYGGILNDGDGVVIDVFLSGCVCCGVSDGVWGEDDGDGGDGEL